MATRGVSVGVKITGDAKGFKVAAEDAKRATEKLNQNFKKVNTTIAGFQRAAVVAFAVVAVRAVARFGKELIDLAAKAEGVKTAFERVANAALLNDLREATRGTVSDLLLMQKTVQASNFRIPLEGLAIAFKFATNRAIETGQSVDYLVNSIIDGIGKKSSMILDNLGISLVEIQTEMKKTGDYTKAVTNIMNRSLAETGDVADTAATRLEQMTTASANLKVVWGEFLTQSKLYEGIILSTTGALEIATIKEITFWQKALLGMKLYNEYAKSVAGDWARSAIIYAPPVIRDPNWVPPKTKTEVKKVEIELLPTIGPITSDVLAKFKSIFTEVEVASYTSESSQLSNTIKTNEAKYQSAVELTSKVKRLTQQELKDYTDSRTKILQEQEKAASDLLVLQKESSLLWNKMGYKNAWSDNDGKIIIIANQEVIKYNENVDKIIEHKKSLGDFSIQLTAIKSVIEAEQDAAAELKLINDERLQDKKDTDAAYQTHNEKWRKSYNDALIADVKRTQEEIDRIQAEVDAKNLEDVKKVQNEILVLQKTRRGEEEEAEILSINQRLAIDLASAEDNKALKLALTIKSEEDILVVKKKYLDKATEDKKQSDSNQALLDYNIAISALELKYVKEGMLHKEYLDKKYKLDLDYYNSIGGIAETNLIKAAYLTDTFNDKFGGIISITNQAESAFVSMFTAISSGSEDAFEDMYKAFGRALQQMAAQMAAKAALFAILMAITGGTGAFAVGAGVIKGGFGKFMGFADGGIVSGPTLANIGEYPGASTNPEVVAPLSKLKDMLGTSKVEVFGKIHGRDIYLSSERYSKILNDNT